MTLNGDHLTVVVEALREYRLRANLVRRHVIDEALIHFIAELAKT